MISEEDTMDERIRRRYVRRAKRLAYYHRGIVALGLGLPVFSWVAAADAWVCQKIGGVRRCWS